MRIPPHIRLANTNQQTTYDSSLPAKNAEASADYWRVFDPKESALDTHKTVIFVGGGSTEELDQAIERNGGRENVVIVLTGSAAFRLNKEAQMEAGYPYVESADAVVFNGVDGDDADDYYTRAAMAAYKHEGVDVYLSSTNGPRAFEVFPNAIKVDGSNPHIEYMNESFEVGLGSTAPTAAQMIFMLKGYKNFEYVGVGGATLQDVPEEQREEFNAAVEALNDPERYTEYDIGNPAWAKIDEGNKVRVKVGNQIADMPSGQVYTAMELAVLVGWGRENGMSFRFNGENTVMHQLLDNGQNLIVANDPRTEQHLTSGSQTPLPQKFVIGGLSKEEGEWRPGGVGRNL